MDTSPPARVILGASLGTAFEWYDFFLYGSLAGTLSKQFFAGVSESTGFIFALLTFSAGFAVRPFGALIFGRLGDLAGRKRAFLTTTAIMGVATTLVGVLPSFERIGIAAPLMLIALRMLQGLALGGEYGGAAIYVAEHAPPDARGRYTSWIQTTSTLALLLSLVVIMSCRALLGDAFESWGWRIPFLLSVVLLATSVYIRLQLAESPVFSRLVAEGLSSRAPIRDAFADPSNRKRMLAALLGASAGMNVVWYGGHLYVLFVLTRVLKVEPQTANVLLATSLAFTVPLYLFFGRLSDRVGRKKVVLVAMGLAALTYFPIFRALTHFANPALEQAARDTPVTVVAAVDACGFRLDPTGKSRVVKSCDIARMALADAGVPYRVDINPDGGVAIVRVGHAPARATIVPAFEGAGLPGNRLREESDRFSESLRRALANAGYPVQADPARIRRAMVLLLLILLMVYVTAVTGPMAAWLVELFPPRIRYTSMSVSYHVGAGWFGGLFPAVAFALVAITGNIYAGLWYAVIVAATTVITGTFLLPETVQRSTSHVGA